MGLTGACPGLTGDWAGDYTGPYTGGLTGCQTVGCTGAFDLASLATIGGLVSFEMRSGLAFGSAMVDLGKVPTAARVVLAAAVQAPTGGLGRVFAAGIAFFSPALGSTGGTGFFKSFNNESLS